MKQKAVWSGRKRVVWGHRGLGGRNVGFWRKEWHQEISIWEKLVFHPKAGRMVGVTRSEATIWGSPVVLVMKGVSYWCLPRANHSARRCKHISQVALPSTSPVWGYFHFICGRQAYGMRDGRERSPLSPAVRLCVWTPSSCWAVTVSTCKHTELLHSTGRTIARNSTCSSRIFK